MELNELMELSADKALDEMSWESIEFLFKPQNQLELLLRMDFEAMKQKIHGWIAYDGPDGMPFRFREPYTKRMRRAIEIETFYRKLVEKRNERRNDGNDAG